MRKVSLVAFLSALLIAVPSAFAQRAEHASGFSGHSGGFAGRSFGAPHFSAPSFGRSASFAPRSFATAPRFTYTAPMRSFMPRSGLAPGYRMPVEPARRRDERGRERYHSPYRGYGYGYPYVYTNSWELLPWDVGYSDFTGYDDGYDSDDSPGDSAAAQQPADYAQPPQPPPDYAVPPDEGYRPDYTPSSYPSAPAAPVAPEPQLTLIYKDGHRQTIRNYVLTQNKVIVLDDAASGREQQVPLSVLNLQATEQAAQQAGLDFSPPA